MYRLKHCRKCYMKNIARDNETEMANIARGEEQGNALTVIQNFLYKFVHHYKMANLYYQSFSRMALLSMYPSVSYYLLPCPSVYTAKTRGIKSSIIFPVL